MHCSVHSTTAQMVSTGVQKYYQIYAKNTVHKDPCTKCGLDDYANAAVRARSSLKKKYQKCLRRCTKQVLIEICQFTVTYAKGTPVDRVLYPVYYRVIKEIMLGQEKLTHPNYGEDHFLPTSDS